ncbi:MAG: hypothetical protein MI919_30485 [Holophagales bacterium]|nr:hypothetical protein [Holophagales bacterium]
MSRDDPTLEALARLAARRAREGNATAEPRHEDMPPPGEDFRAGLVAEILRRQQRDRQESSAATAAPGPGAPVAGPAVGGTAGELGEEGIEAIPPPFVRGTGTFRAALALAAGLLVTTLVVWLAIPGPPGREGALPAYGLEVLGAQRKLRGDGAESQPAGRGSFHLAPGNLLELRLRPADEVAGPLEVTARRLRGGRWVPFEAELRLSEQGSATLRAVAGSEHLPPGEHELWLAVHRPDAEVAPPSPGARPTAAERTPGGTGSEETRTGETAEGAAIRGASPREGAHVWHLRLSVGEGP